MKNGGNIITVVVLIIGMAVAWGIIRTEVNYNAVGIDKNFVQIDHLKTWANQVDIQYTEIRVKLQNIEALLLDVKSRIP